MPARRDGSLGWSLRALAREAKAHDEEVMPRPGATCHTPDMCPAS
ncbi:hypothetical protein T261_3991 [Streptomyces lydicus]|nr:hypothetical protein T261_3991 [Streptomyces lydicus]